MSWTLLLGVVLILGLSLFAAASRRAELARMGRTVRDRDRALRLGADAAKLQHPVVDLSRCLGCATCVAVCPEDGVLEIVHGQAVVVNGARCEGISACERECPVGAITVTIANLETRTDVPVLTERLEAEGAPGLFLAGEVTAHALIKTAIEHGTAVAREAARRPRADREGVFDLVVVGAGPAGLACSLEAKRLGLSFVTIDQEERPGGTVAKYPRRKLVLTQPVDMPVAGRLERTSYTKEELIELWQRIAAEQALPIAGGLVFRGLERDAEGRFTVQTDAGSYTAMNVCLAIGRRGVPRKLGVPGEELPKVAYSLLDAASYRDRRILVVGGGDSAVEAAMGLAEQPGNEVTLSYRKQAFFRIKARNEARLERALAAGRLRVVHGSRLTNVRQDEADLEVEGADGSVRGETLANDEVFVMAGGVPPFELLERSGVSFDPTRRQTPGPRPDVEQGTGLVKALKIGFGLSLVALLFALWHADYYTLSAPERPAHQKHDLLRPGKGLGLFLGITAALLILGNLLYLIRRGQGFGLTWGSLRAWMTSHLATGILAFLCATLHGAMDPRDTVGGHAWWALALLLVTGAIGRYFYAWIPRAANGRELEIEEIKARLGGVSEDLVARSSAQRAFRERAREEVSRLIDTRQWRGSFLGRVLAMIGLQRDLRRTLAALDEHGLRENISIAEVRETRALTRRAYRTALAAAHLEDLRAVLGTWRYFHRWVAALMVVLVVFHVVYALVYGESTFRGGIG
jgi:thioredoxin reductase